MIFDLHNDLPTNRAFITESSRVSNSVIYAFWTTELNKPLNFILNAIPHLCGAPFGIEDLGFADEKSLKALCMRKPHYCSLTHNGENGLAGGALSDGKLTEKGVSFIRTLNDCGIAVDGAHLNRKSFYKAAEISKRFIVSHAGFGKYVKHPRNLTVNQVKTVLSSGGIIGITAVSDFIGGNDIDDYVKTIDCFVQTFGADGAAIGTDFYGTKPLQGLDGYADFYNLANKLINLGYGYADVGKIFYDNAKNYFLYRRNT